MVISMYLLKGGVFMKDLRRNIGFFCVALFLFVFITAPADAATYFVRAGGAGDKSGRAWENALDERGFIEKLERASAGDVFCVAKGAYRPVVPKNAKKSTEAERKKSFNLKDGVQLYGGFSGREAMSSFVPVRFKSALASRDLKANVTVLTGDLVKDNRRDANGVTLVDEASIGSENNSYSVVTSKNCTNAAVLDGFVISGGTASYYYLELTGKGGGMYNINSSPTVRNCTFTANMASRGAGMYNKGGAPQISACKFVNNMCHGEFAYETYGGGIYSENSNLSVSDCTFTYNFARFGGGIYSLGGAVSISGSTFDDNAACSGGGICSHKSRLTLQNSTFYKNTENDFSGSALLAKESRATILYCTFTANEAIKGKYALVFKDSSAAIAGSILWNSRNGEVFADKKSRIEISHSVINADQGKLPQGAGNTNQDPKLLPLAHNGGPTQTCAIQSGSSAIKAGAESSNVFEKAIPAPTVDQRGYSRTSPVDIGAYEYR